SNLSYVEQRPRFVVSFKRASGCELAYRDNIVRANHIALYFPSSFWAIVEHPHRRRNTHYKHNRSGRCECESRKPEPRPRRLRLKRGLAGRVQQRIDLAPQLRGRCDYRKSGSQLHTELYVVVFLAARLTHEQVLADATRLFSRQLAVAVRRKHFDYMLVKHLHSPAAISPRRCPSFVASILWPRLSRDETVPIEHPSASAISSYDKPSTYLSRIGIRSFGLSSAIAPLTDSDTCLR